jgi:UDP-N-acetylglucosamine transferase subunit ALG13
LKRALSQIFDHYDRADRILIALSSAFDFPATRQPANMRYVGPLLDQPLWAQPWTAPWTERPGRARVLVSLSTSFQNQLSLLNRIIATLGQMDLDAVVTVGPAMAQETIDAPANVAILHSAPHDSVMREVALVITHGGHGTVTRSLTHGVPLLVLPMGRDQADNAARVVARGAGLALIDTATEEEIERAVMRLLTEPHFQAAASRLGNAMVAELGSLAVVAENWFRPVHCRSVSAQEMRALLSTRKTLQKAFLDIEGSLRGVLRNFGLKLGAISKGRYEQRVGELVAGNKMLEAASAAVLQARAALGRNWLPSSNGCANLLGRMRYAGA